MANCPWGGFLALPYKFETSLNSLTQAKRICMCESQNPFRHTPLPLHSDIHPHNKQVCTLRKWKRKKDDGMSVALLNISGNSCLLWILKHDLFTFVWHLWYTKMSLLWSVDVQVAPLRLCFYLLFYVFVLSLFTCITSALIIYNKRTLLDIGHRCHNLLQDTLSMNPTWPLEILRNTEENKGHLNNPRRPKKHRGKRAGIRNRLREMAHNPLFDSNMAHELGSGQCSKAIW